MEAYAGIPTTPVEVLAAAQACLAAADIPAFDSHIDRLLRMAPHWYEALLFAAASFEPRDLRRAEELYRRALHSRADAREAAAGLVRCRIAVGSPVPFPELALMAQMPPVVDAIDTARSLAAAYKWKATGFISQMGQSLTGTVVGLEGAVPRHLVLRPAEDSQANSFTDLLQETPTTGPDLWQALVYTKGDSQDVLEFEAQAPAAGRYLAVLLDESKAPLGCLLPLLTVRDGDAVDGEIWWSHGGVVSGWVKRLGGHPPDLEIISDPPARPLAQTIAPLTHVASRPDEYRLFGFVAVLPLDASRQSIEVRVKDSARALRGSPLRVQGICGLALTPGLHSSEIEDPDWHLLPKIQRVFGSTPSSTVVDVVIPVYRDFEKTERCIESVLSAKTQVVAHLVVINDRSPSPSLTRYIQSLQARGVTVVENSKNLGFSGAVNVGIRQHRDRDVVLLNADTEVADGWLDRLVASLKDSADIATVTPMSNNATILSYPTVHAVNPFLTRGDLWEMDQVVARGRSEPIEIPTAVGFCMLIRRACLNDCGDFDEVNFGRGYGEENEFCLRATSRGWRHVCAPNVFVAHDGGASFAGLHDSVQQRRLKALHGTFKGYDRFIHRFVRSDPMLPVRRAADVHRLSKERPPTFLMVMPDLVGGTARHVDDLCRALERDGVRCLILSEVKDTAASGKALRIKRWRESIAMAGASDESKLDPFPNMVFGFPFESGELRRTLKQLSVCHVHIHHFVDMSWDVVVFSTQLGLPYDVTVHDYSWLCPRVTMVGPSQRYCSEPDLAGCNACVAIAGDRTGSKLGAAALRERSSSVFLRARAVFVPSADVSARMKRYFPEVEFATRPHMFSAAVVPAPPTYTDTVAIVGAINSDKGYDVLFACARDAAARNLSLRFAVIGFTQDDAPLLRTGRVSITGRYAENEVLALLASSGARVGWIPSICPETWSYALSQLIAAGLLPVAFDLGTPAERIRALGHGFLFPLDLQPHNINNALLNLVRRPHDLTRLPSDGGQYGHMPTDYYGLTLAADAFLRPGSSSKNIGYSSSKHFQEGISSPVVERLSFDSGIFSRIPLHV